MRSIEKTPSVLFYEISRLVFDALQPTQSDIYRTAQELIEHIGEFLTHIFVADDNIDFAELRMLAILQPTATVVDNLYPDLMEGLAKWFRQTDDVHRPYSTIPAYFLALARCDQRDGQNRTGRLLALLEQLGNAAIEVDGQSHPLEHRALQEALQPLRIALNWQSSNNATHWDFEAMDSSTFIGAMT